MKNIQQLQTFLKDRKIAVAIITDPDSIVYYSRYACERSERISALLVFADKESVFFCPEIEFDLVLASKWQGKFFGYTDNEDPYKKLAEYFLDLAVVPQKILIEETHLTLDRKAGLEQIFPAAAFVFGSGFVAQQRMIKNNEEKIILKKAAAYADTAVDFLAKNLQAGQTEAELVRLVEQYLSGLGLKQMTFPTSVYFEGDTLQENSLVCIDLGVVYQNYCSDITRTLVFGQITKQQREVYEVVYRAQSEAIRQAVKGRRASELDTIARKIITEAGYGEYYPHRLGHGLGLSGHEKPALSQLDDTVLKPGMVITIEPGIYLPDIAHVRIEDMLLVTETGNEILTSYPKKIAVE